MLPLAIVISFLSGLTDLKLFDIQSVEVAVVAAIGLNLVMSRTKMVIAGAPMAMSLLPKTVWLFFFLIAGSLLSLRLHFYPPLEETSMFKQAPFATFVRLVEVMISISSLFIVALAGRDSPAALRAIMTAYVSCALLNAVWGVFCWIAWLGGVTLPGITDVDLDGIARIRGFFSEGGPFGVYMVSAVIVQMIRGHFLKYVSPRSFYVGLGVLVLALIGSQSKAAALIGICALIVYVIRVRSGRLVIFFGMAAIVLAMASNLVQGLEGYYKNFADYEAAARERPEDWSLLMGRLAASVLLPRIIADHPVLGIGIGNYSLVRNDPSYLLGLPRVEKWDLHGLGLLGYLAELGIPLTLFVLWFYATPLINAWRTRPWIVLLCCYPLLAALFGVQINFAYPWIVMGMGLIAIEAHRRHVARLQHGSSQPVTLSAPAGPAGLQQQRPS